MGHGPWRVRVRQVIVPGGCGQSRKRLSLTSHSTFSSQGCYLLGFNTTSQTLFFSSRRSVDRLEKVFYAYDLWKRSLSMVLKSTIVGYVCRCYTFVLTYNFNFLMIQTYFFYHTVYLQAFTTCPLINPPFDIS